ncbi:glycosyltransferase [Clostridium perfringens]|uniref:glycosyltransferase family 2 protein n=1 Tax=Clostridium perfringens TaxID=1502 RepID=UPI0024BBF4C2|nr:glycosyltransferase family 2 protein [Clostridium perfringens]MDZ5015619.1 glycosyltransferase [Clostridium perfringens]
MSIKFSIITVSFNSEDTIKETINSVLNQTYQNYEHIIIDGLSNDRTINIINEYKKSQAEKVIIKSEKDNGIYEAMNKGIELASGDLVVFLNSDDTFETNALELIANNYSDNIDIIYGNVSWIESFYGKVYEKKLNLAPLDIDKIYVNTITKECLEKIKNAHNATFVKLNILKNNKFDEKLKICSDYKFFLNMYIQKKVVCYIPYKITNMKMGGISTTQLERGLIEHIKCEEEILGKSNVDFKNEIKKINKQNIIKKLSKKFLPKKYYIKFRYLNRGWNLK